MSKWWIILLLVACTDVSHRVDILYEHTVLMQDYDDTLGYEILVTLLIQIKKLMNLQNVLMCHERYTKSKVIS